MCGLWPLTPNRVWASRKPLTHTQTNIEVFWAERTYYQIIIDSTSNPAILEHANTPPTHPEPTKIRYFRVIRERRYTHTKKGGGELIFCCGIQKQKSGYKIIITIVH